MAQQTRRLTSKRTKRKVAQGVIHVQVGYNNTMATVTDRTGDVLFWCSAGSCNFKGTRKGTPFAAQRVAETVARQATDRGIKNASIVIKGFGPGRKKALRGLWTTGLRITAICDITPVPHNGCRPPKRRRV